METPRMQRHPDLIFWPLDSDLHSTPTGRVYFENDGIPWRSWRATRDVIPQKGRTVWIAKVFQHASSTHGKYMVGLLFSSYDTMPNGGR